MSVDTDDFQELADAADELLPELISAAKASGEIVERVVGHLEGSTPYIVVAYPDGTYEGFLSFE